MADQASSRVEDIWEPFLTERDRRHHAASGWTKAEPFGFGKRPALLIVDAYYSVLGLERQPLLDSVLDWPMSCGLEGWEAVDRTATLLASARAHGIPVIFAKGLAGFPSWLPAKRPPSPRLTADELARGHEIVDELRPEPGELVIEKAAASVFHGTPVLFHLQRLGIDTIITCGETTSGCVRASVVDGATYRYHMGVVADCCFDRTESAHAINLFDMHHKYGDVIDLATAMTFFACVAP